MKATGFTIAEQEEMDIEHPTLHCVNTFEAEQAGNANYGWYSEVWRRTL